MVYGYCRVSTNMQAKDGNSLEVQEKLLKENGAEEIYSDAFTGSACCICFLLYKRGRPSLKPGCFFAIALPSCVRSIIMSRSNSAKASMILRISFPVGVLSINPIFNTCIIIPLFNNAWIISVSLYGKYISGSMAIYHSVSKLHSIDTENWVQ